MGEAYWDILEQHGTNMCAERNIQLLSILLEPLANTFLTMSNIVYMWQFQIGGQDGCSTIPIPDRSRLGEIMHLLVYLIMVPLVILCKMVPHA